MTGATAFYLTPRLLAKEHRVANFVSASTEQTSWLIDHAQQSHYGDFTRVLVVTERGSADVVAYYAWTMSSVRVADAPARLSRGGGSHPVPMALLARLAVDTRHEGRGLGRNLLRDVLLRTAAASEQIGCRGLLIHCESDAAREFYLRCVPTFEQSPSDPMHLVLLMKDLRAAVGP